MCSLKPAQQIASFTVEQRVEQVESYLDRLAKEQGLELNGSFDNREQAMPPVHSLTIGTRSCVIIAERSGTAVVISLHVVEGGNCPNTMRTIFENARRGLT